MNPAFRNAHWFKSEKSTNGGDCVEVAYVFTEEDEVGVLVGVRDSKHPGEMLQFGTKAWCQFLGGLKGGDFSFN